MNVRTKYPWTDYMLDIHHLLPLSSNLKINNQGTSLSDIVALCPSCHKSIHIYYAKWLNRQGQDDFISQDEAKAVYLAAKLEMT
jgi:predicted HNH restriction endonuclease